MKKNYWALLFLATVSLISSSGHAFSGRSFYLGIGYYSQNFLGEITQSADGSASTLGEASYPLLLKYDFSIDQNWFLAPQLTYTLLPRQSAGDTAKVTIMHLMLQIGKNFGGDSSSKFDWYAGPGYLSYDIKGAGGTTVMNNGTTTATFAIPGRTATIQKITFNAGASYSYNTSSRFGFDLILENIMSSTKRTQSFMLSYAYCFNGGLF